MTKSQVTRSVGIHEAKTHLSQLLRVVEAGGEVQIRRGNTPIARLVPAEEPRPARQLGTLKGRVRMADDFFAMDAEIEAAFDSSEIFPPEQV